VKIDGEGARKDSMACMADADGMWPGRGLVIYFLVLYPLIFTHQS
jgi:hypothetical protein